VKGPAAEVQAGLLHSLSPVLADQAGQHAEYLQRTLRAYHRIGLVGGAQDELAALLSSVFNVNSLSTIATTMSPMLAFMRFSTTAMSPSWMLRLSSNRP